MATTGYGVEIYCDDRLRTGRLSRGIVTVGLAQYRRLITRRGTVRQNQQPVNYGLALDELVGQLGVEASVVMLPSLIRAELAKDDRVASIGVDVRSEEIEPGGWRVVVVVRVTAYDESGAFEFTLGVTTDGVDLIASRTIEEAA